MASPAEDRSTLECVVQLLAPVDQAAARRQLRAQIARLERELAATLATTYPRIVTPAGPRAARPRLLGLAELERSRDALAARVGDRPPPRRRAAEQPGRCPAAARPRCSAAPPALKGAVIHNARARAHGLHDLPRRPAPARRLVAGEDLLRLSLSPVSRHNKRRRRPRNRSRPSRRARPGATLEDRIDERPKPPWHPFPLIEIAVLSASSASSWASSSATRRRPHAAGIRARAGRARRPRHVAARALRRLPQPHADARRVPRRGRRGRHRVRRPRARA